MIDSNHNNTEIPADPHEEQESHLNVKVIAARSKAKAKPQKREPVDVPKITTMNKRKWIDIEPSEPSLAAYEVSKKVINLLRHNQTVQREEDGTIQFCRIKFHLRNQFSQIQHWSDERWKACVAAGGGSKRRYQYSSDNLGTILYFRALQGHSGSNLIDPTLQDNVVIGTGIFHYIYHVGCAFNLQSIINNGLILGGQDLSRRQTVIFLPVDPRDESHKDPEHIDFSIPRRARYLHSAWKKHQDAVFWVDIDLAIKKGLTFYQTRSNAIILQGTLPACCIPKVVRLKTGEVCMRNHTCLFDHRQRSHYDTITIGPEGKINWVLQLNNSQSVNTFDRLVEKFNTKSSPNQPNQNPNQFVIDRGNLIAQKMCLLLQEKRPVPTRSMKKVCTKNLFLQIDQGNLMICLKTPGLSKLTMEQGNLLGETAQVHTVKEQFAPEENRDIALFNTDNEFNSAINEENNDFNVQITTFTSETITWRQRSKI